MRQMFGRNYREIEGAILARLDKPDFHYAFAFKGGFPWVSLQKVEDKVPLELVVVVQEPNPAVFGEGGR